MAIGLISLAGLGTSRSHFDGAADSARVARRHLAATRVVDAHEQDARFFGHRATPSNIDVIDIRIPNPSTFVNVYARINA